MSNVTNPTHVDNGTIGDLELDFTGPALGDEILLASVADTKIAKVRTGRSSTARESRAWSFSGNID